MDIEGNMLIYEYVNGYFQDHFKQNNTLNMVTGRLKVKQSIFMKTVGIKMENGISDTFYVAIDTLGMCEL